MSDTEDVELMLRVRAGEHDAFRSLLGRYQDRVMGLAYRLLGDRDDAEDLTQQVFLNVYQARRSYRPQAKFGTWLYRITMNLSLNAVRARKIRGRRPVLREGDPDEGGFTLDRVADPRGRRAGDVLEREEIAAKVREVVNELPKDQRAAVLLSKFEGCSHQEIAEILEKSVPAVKSLLVRARTRIKDRLAPYLQRERVS